MEKPRAVFASARRLLCIMYDYLTAEELQASTVNNLGWDKSEKAQCGRSRSFSDCSTVLRHSLTIGAAVLGCLGDVSWLADIINQSIRVLITVLGGPLVPLLFD